MEGPAEVELRSGTLVIGDLHLDVEDPAALERFETWLAGARGAPRLVILGDLFEYWVGPAQGSLPGARRVTGALRRLVENGTAVDVIPGNRDFLLGADFERASGARIHENGFVGVPRDGGRVLFLHGDELATLDHGYRRLRAVLRSPLVTGMAPWIPRPLALGLAARLRRASHRAVSAKPRETLALQPDAVRAHARHHAADVLVCGHAHRFRDELFDGGPRWIVVDAFGGARDTLELFPGGFRVRVERPAAAPDHGSP